MNREIVIFGKCCQGEQESRSRASFAEKRFPLLTPHRGKRPFLFVTVAELKTMNCVHAILRSGNSDI